MAKLEPKIPQHLPGERDYGLERSFRRGFTQWPFNIAYGLNSFELFQGLNNFLIRTVNGFFGSLPGSHKLMDSNSYIETSLTLTRFRNYHDKVI